MPSIVNLATKDLKKNVGNTKNYKKKRITITCIIKLNKMKKIKFKNNKGKDLKTTISEDIMNQVANLTEEELKSKGVFYIRDGSKFQVKQDDVKTLLEAQVNANTKLVSEGIITIDMLLNDIKANS